MTPSAFPVIAAWLTCFTILNVMVKSLSSSRSPTGVWFQVSTLLANPKLYVAGMLYGTCAFLYFLTLARMPLSVAGPTFMTLGLLTTVIVGVAVFGEPLGALKIAGLVGCVVGVALISL